MTIEAAGLLKLISDFFFFLLYWVFFATRGLSLVAVCGLLTAVTSLVVEHGF